MSKLNEYRLVNGGKPLYERRARIAASMAKMNQEYKDAFPDLWNAFEADKRNNLKPGQKYWLKDRAFVHMLTQQNLI